MEQTFTYSDSLTKAERYAAFIDDYRLLIEGEDDRVSLLANTAAALREAFGFFWVGFYLVHDADWLHLGPFQGPVACSRIRRGRGVCGTAWAEARTIVVPDVDQFPGHIACSSASRSEIVIPLIPQPSSLSHQPSAISHQPSALNPILGVLDIDSDHLNAFDECDRQGLETIVDLLLH